MIIITIPTKLAQLQTDYVTRVSDEIRVQSSRLGHVLVRSWERLFRSSLHCSWVIEENNRVEAM